MPITATHNQFDSPNQENKQNFSHLLFSGMALLAPYIVSPYYWHRWVLFVYE